MFRERFATILCLAIATLAVALVVPAAAQGAPAVGAGGPGDHALGSTDASGLASSGDVAPALAALEHEYDDREHVDELAELHPWSAVGGIFTDTAYGSAGEQVGTTSTGVLVSDRHVLTAAHVVTDDSGDAETQKDFWFAPGMTEIDGETTLYYGRAEVETIRVDPDYDGGDDNADDVALLTLDRPIGEQAGHFDLAAIDDETAWGDRFYFFGYPGDDQLRRGVAEGDEARSIRSPPHIVEAEFEQGDSGGPLFKDPNDPAVYSVVSGITTFAGKEITPQAAPITADRRDWIEARMDEDGASLHFPELYRADRVGWIDDGTQRAPSEITPADEGEFATTLYNNGHESTTANVAFYLHQGAGLDAAPDREPICTASVRVPATDTATASCTGTTPSDVEESQTYSVSPVFEADESEHWTTRDRTYHLLDATSVVAPAEDPTTLADVSAPDSVTAGESFDVTATVANDASYEETVTVQFGTEEQLAVEPKERTVTVPAGGEADATVSWDTSTASAGETFPQTVSAGGDSQTVEVAVVTDATPKPEIHLRSFDPPDGEVGEPYSFELDWYNEGGSGYADVDAYAYGPDDEEFFELIGNEKLGEVSGLDSGTLEFETTPDEEFAEAATIRVRAYNGDDLDPGHKVSDVVAFEPAAPETTVAIEALRDPVMPTAEVVDVGATVENAGSTETETTVTVSVDGEAASSTAVTVPAGERQRVDLQAPVDPEAGGQLDVAVSADSGGSDERTVDVAEPLNLTLRGEYEPEPSGEDGLYRDLNGDGTVGHGDIAVFFRTQHRSIVKDHGAYFDFSGNGVVTHGDVVSLLDYVALS